MTEHSPAIEQATQPSRHAIWIVALCAVTAATLTIVATRHGPGISPDSIVYLAAARSIARGAGVLASGGADYRPLPMTHFPPLYPLMLAAGKWMWLRPMSIARYLGALWAALNVVMVALLTRRVTGGIWPTIMAAALTALSADFLTTHIFAYSEPPVLLLDGIVVLLLASHLRRPSMPQLLGAAACAAMACLTRYAAVALVLAGAIGLLTLSHATRRRRFRDAAIFVTPAAFSLFGWMVRNRIVAGTIASRPIVWHFGSVYQLKTLFATIASALAANSLGPSHYWIAAMTAVGLIGLIVPALLVKPRPTLSPTAGLLALVVVAHLGLSMIVLESSMPLDSRLMAPAFPPAVVLVIAGVYAASRRRQRARSNAHRLAISVAVVAILSSAIGTGLKIKEFAANGAGYNSIRWRASPVLAAANALPRHVPIISNAADVVYFRESIRAGWAYDDTHARLMHLVPEDLRSLQSDISVAWLRRGGVLLFAHGVRPTRLNETELRDALPVRRVAHDEYRFELYHYDRARDRLRDLPATTSPTDNSN